MSLDSFFQLVEKSIWSGRSNSGEGQPSPWTCWTNFPIRKSGACQLRAPAHGLAMHESL